MISIRTYAGILWQLIALGEFLAGCNQIDGLAFLLGMGEFTQFSLQLGDSIF